MYLRHFALSLLQASPRGARGSQDEQEGQREQGGSAEHSVAQGGSADEKAVVSGQGLIDSAHARAESIKRGLVCHDGSAGAGQTLAKAAGPPSVTKPPEDLCLNTF